jgi:autotransporter-associated beta strand protein
LFNPLHWLLIAVLASGPALAEGGGAGGGGIGGGASHATGPGDPGGAGTTSAQGGGGGGAGTAGGAGGQGDDFPIATPGGPGGPTQGAAGGAGTAGSGGPSGGGGGGGGAHGGIFSNSSSNAGAIVGGAGGAGGASGPTGAGGGGGAGGFGLIVDSAGAVTVLNTGSGTISGAAGGAGGNSSVTFSAGGGGDGGNGMMVVGSSATVGNSGTITGGTGGAGGNGGGGGNGGAGGAGLAGSNLTVDNAGTITGGNGGAGGTGASGSGGAGIVGSGLTITLSGSGTISGGLNGDGATRANAITFTGGANTLTKTSGASTINGNIAVTGSLNLNQSSNVTLSNVITGTGSVSKSGAGTLELSGSNTYSGGTTINAGTLAISNDGNLGAAAGSLTFDGGTLRVLGSLTTSRAITLQSGGGSLVVDATGTLNGVVDGAGGLTVDGFVTLNRNNTYTGGTTLSGGVGTILRLGVDGALASTGALTVNGGTLLLNGHTQTVGALSGTGGIVNLTGGTLTAGDDASTRTLDSTITGAGSFIKQGTGTLTLTGSNDYSGGTAINSGTLSITSLDSLGTGAITFNGGTLSLDALGFLNNAIVLGSSGGTVSVSGVVGGAGFISGDITGPGTLTKMGAAVLEFTSATSYSGDTLVREGTLLTITQNFLSPNSAFTVFSGASLGIIGAQTIGSLAGDGNVDNFVPAGFTSTLTAGGNNTATTFNGVLGDGTAGGNLALIKAGTQTMTLTGTNTYTGATTINAGTLALSGSGSIAQSSGVALTASGAIFDISGTTSGATIQDLTGVAGSTVALGARTLTFGTSNDTTFDGVLTGTGGIVKQGSGTVILTGTNGYIGGTAINAGTLQIGDGVTQGKIVGSVTVGNGAFFNVFNADTTGITAVTTNAGGQTTFSNAGSAGSGTILTTGSNAFTFFQDTSTAGSATVTVQNSGTVQFMQGSTAGTATIATDNSNVVFFDSSSAGSAIVTANNGGTVRFFDTSSGGTGRFIANAGGTVDFSGLGSAGTTAGSIEGAGRVLLGSRSLTVGSNDLSTTMSGVISGSGGSLVKVGSGTLTLSGINTYTGTTTVSAGILAVNGSLTSNTTVNAGATLQGNGTITGSVNVAGAIAPGNSIGTLSVTGNYGQTGTYNVEVNNAGQSDKIVVVGAATIAGTLAVQAQAGAYQRIVTYTILTATGGVSGGYSTVTSTSAALTPSVVVGGNAVTLTLFNTAAVLPGSDTGTFTGNQQTIADVLNQASGTASGDLNTVMNALFNLTPAQLGPVLTALGGTSYSGFSSLLVQSTQLFMDSFQIQGGSGGGGGGANLRGGSTYQALRIDGGDACETACDVEPLWGAWGGGMGAFGTIAGSATANGLTYNLGGFIAGLDRRFAPGFRAGVAAGFNAASLYPQGVPGNGTSNTLQFAVYGEYLQEAFYLDALAGYGHSDNRMSRPIIIPGLNQRTAQGYTTANTFFGQLEAGYKLAIAPSFGGFVTPFARLQASTSTQNGFTESGADSLNLTVAAQTTNSLRTVLGAQLGAAIDAPWREKLNLTMRLGWSHEFADTGRPVTASFTGAPALGFTTFGAVAPRDGVVLGLGGSTNVAERTSVYLRYDGDLAGGNTNHVLNAGVRYVW